MDIYHRVTFGKYDNVDEQLKSIGVKFKKAEGLQGYYILTLEIYEPDPNWREVNRLVQAHKALDLYDTFFSDEDVLGAEWLRLTPTYEHGYPYPRNKWLDTFYNYEDHCRECGTFRQKSSFFLQKEPSLRKNDFMCLIWTWTFFCRYQVFDQLAQYQVRGYEQWDAIIHSTKQPSAQVAQLIVPQIAQPGLTGVEDLPRVECSTCGITKYHPHLRGVMYLDRTAISRDTDLLQTYEWFGHGHHAHREVLVSQRLAKLALERKWKGIRFKVVELV